MWHCVLVRCSASQSIGLGFGCAFFWCWVSLCVPLTNSSVELQIMTIIGIFMDILFILDYTFRLSVTMQFFFNKCTPSWMFPPMNIPFEYWIGHVAFGPLYVMSRVSTRIFYSGVSAFVADCFSGVCCRILTICLLYIRPLLWNPVCNDSGVCKFDIMENNFYIVFDYVLHIS